MGTLSITNITSSPVNLQDLYITVQPNDTVNVERRWNELAAMSYLHEAIADGKITVDFDPSEDERASGLVPSMATREDEEVNHAFYVAPTGSDSNNGLSPLTPVKTFDAAMNKLPTEWGGQCRIFLSPGTYTAALPPEYYYHYIIGAGRGPGKEGLGIIGGFDTVLDNLTISSLPSAGVIEDDTQSMTPNEYVGAQLRFTSGARAGTAMRVRSNTATTFTVNYNASPSPGDSFRIEQPNVIIESDYAFLVEGMGRNASTIVLHGLHLKIDQIIFDNIEVIFGGVTVELPPAGSTANRLTAWGDSHFSFAMSDYDLAGISGTRGIYLTGGHYNSAIMTLPTASASGYVIQRDSGQYLSGDIDYYNLDLDGGMITAYDGCDFWHNGVTGLRGQIANSPESGFFVLNNCHVLGLTNIDINDCAHHAVLIHAYTTGEIWNVAGSGNGRYGVSLTRASTVYLGSTTVTGSFGDVEVDGTGIDYATAIAGYTGARSYVEGE